MGWLTENVDELCALIIIINIMAIITIGLLVGVKETSAFLGYIDIILGIVLGYLFGVKKTNGTAR